MTDVTFEPDFELEVDPKDLELEFMPGCFDGFEGTQEELDKLVEELKRAAKTGELFYDVIEVSEEEFEEMQEAIKDRSVQ